MFIQYPDGRVEHVPVPPPRWYQTFLQALQRAIATYQYWNAFYLHPRHYGQAPHCYATLQQAVSVADRLQRQRCPC